MPAAKQITGENHVTGVDARPSPSRLLDDMSILQDFVGGASVDMSTAVTMMGFLVAGHCEEVDEFLEITRGLPYCETVRNERGIRCVVVTGAVCDWQRAIIEGNRWTLERSSIRSCFNSLYHLFVQKGLGYLFTDFRPVDHGGIMLLEKK